MDLYSWAIVIHIIGAVIGVGAVTIHDLQYIRAFGDRDLGIAFQKSAEFYGKLIKGGLTLLVTSGLYFMFSHPFFWSSEKILTKLALVVILILNGLVINFILGPKLHKITAEDWAKKTPALKSLAFSRLPFDVISITTWYAILFLGAAGRQPWSAVQIAIVYILALAIVFFAGRILFQRRFS